MSILVTGSTGFIGANLCMKLAGQGNRVHALYRSENKAAGLNNPGIILFKGDILDPRSLDQALKGCTELYHTAAFTEVWSDDPDHVYRLNVQGTLNVLEAAVRNNVKDIVITSTAGVFGPSVDGQVDENTHPQIPYFTEYERTKALAQQKAMEYIKKGLNIRIVNPTRVFGPGRLSKSNSVTKMILGYSRGSWRFIPGDGKKTGNYAFVDDVVNGHILAMNKGKAGNIYILGGHDLSYAEFFDSLARVSGKKRFMFRLPIPLLMLISRGAMLAFYITGKSPFITPGLVKKFNHHWFVSSQKAINEIGFTITPLEKALKITLEKSILKK